MEDNGLKILEAIENDYDYKLIDHVFIFHSLIYAFVVSIILNYLALSIRAIYCNSSTTFTSSFLILYWEFFLVCFSLEGWWGLWNDRFNIKMDFLSFILTTCQPLFIFVLHHFLVLYDKLNCSIIITPSKDFVQFSPFFYLFFSFNIFYIIFLKKQCYFVYNHEKQSIKDRQFIACLLLFWFVWNYCIINTQNNKAINILYYSINVFAIVVSFWQLFKFVEKYRKYEYALLNQNVRIQSLMQIGKYIYLILKRDYSSKDSMNSEEGFAFIRMHIINYDKKIFNKIRKLLRSYDDFTALKTREKDGYLLDIFIPYLREQSNLSVVYDRLSKSTNINKHSQIHKNFIKFSHINKELLKKNKYITLHNIVQFLQNTVDKWSK